MYTEDNYLSTLTEATLEEDVNCDNAMKQAGAEQQKSSLLLDQGNVVAGVHFKQMSLQRNYPPVYHEHNVAVRAITDELADEDNGSDINGCSFQQRQTPKRLDSNKERRREIVNTNSTDKSITHSRFLHFMWRCDMVERWISEKEIYVKGENFGQTLSSVQVFYRKQTAFNNKLAAYAVDGVYPLFDLKDRLLKGNHQLSTKIVRRHDQVMSKWQVLRNASEMREIKLMQMLAKHQRVDDVLANFAKKASAFHLKCENAEKRLATTVRCTTSAELATQCAKSTQLLTMMSSIRKDLEELEVLDTKIKSIKNIHVPRNPHTCLTIESLQEILNNLDNITNERNNQLKKEAKRQQELNKMRIKFDLSGFSWLTHVPMFAPFRWL
ncbi:spectrin alpha chain isoform 2 [Tropilaelaps mercedesae]|uniref:Spectrin alpha chain isoform 2 n=1 Tax=Tropilaelaps mercedesae TaxID=418985 RepID=A0A1V9Y1S3_9ACAR|nr:spectrin alpha chain isoform 2 [Tropilaelaps mercedesae]